MIVALPGLFSYLFFIIRLAASLAKAAYEKIHSYYFVLKCPMLLKYIDEYFAFKSRVNNTVTSLEDTQPLIIEIKR